jgi:Ni,Fe-hydrogenase III large subunit
MSFTAALKEKGTHVAGHRPWPRRIVGADVWRQAVLGIAEGEATMLALWSDGEAVHMALLLGEGAGAAPPADCGPIVLSIDAAGGRYPSVGLTHPPALRLERAIRDLYGIEPEGLPDSRPWLDHNWWGLAQPLGAANTVAADGASYAFLTAEGPPLHQIPVGPVHAGIIEPGHFRFHANGETVVRLEERLGYVHKGIEGLLAGAPLDRAARIAGRVSGDSTVAYALAFSRAVEAALDMQVPPRAHVVRAVMAEMERLANHFGDIGAICNDASFSLMQAHCWALRERILRASAACFGHRLMMDCIVPGGVTADFSGPGVQGLRELVKTIHATYPSLVDLYDNTTSLQDRTVATGILRGELVRRFGAGGPVGRASGRPFDVRRALPYEPYGSLAFATALKTQGDVDARVWVRFFEIEQSLSIIEQVLMALPGGALRAELPAPTGAAPEGLAIVEGFRGDVLAWVRLAADGSVARAHLRDPSWFQWPLLEAAIEGNIVADFPLCNKSFNCSYSGHDL